MGYISIIELNGVRVKPNKEAGLLKAVNLCKKHTADYLASGSKTGMKLHPNILKLRKLLKQPKGQYLFWHIEALEVRENNLLDVDDPEQKWYDDELLAVFLADKISEGDIYFRGEDGTNWGFRFDGKGNFKRLTSKWVEQ